MASLDMALCQLVSTSLMQAYATNAHHDCLCLIHRSFILPCMIYESWPLANDDEPLPNMLLTWSMLAGTASPTSSMKDAIFSCPKSVFAISPTRPLRRPNLNQLTREAMALVPIIACFRSDSVHVDLLFRLLFCKFP
jgi:hypothetical protein